MSDDIHAEIRDANRRLAGELTKRSFKTGAQRNDDKGKPTPALIPLEPLKRVQIHYRKGADAHGKNNWTNGMPYSEFYNSATRHLQDWWSGDESEDHLAAVVWNIMSLMYIEDKKPELDDREEDNFPI